MTRGAAARVVEDRSFPAEAAYDSAAPFYDGWKWQAFWRAYEFPLVRDALQDWASAHGPPRLLDVGCGTGWYLERLQRQAREVVGVDISAGMLKEAQRRLPAAHLAQADASALPFADRSFDVVMSTRVLAHIADVDQPLAEINRLIRPGGLAILTNVDAHHDYDRTRLPCAGGRVAAETYKHGRAIVAGVLAGKGLRHQATTFIHLNGAPVRADGLDDEVASPIVGWMSLWRR